MADFEIKESKSAIERLRLSLELDQAYFRRRLNFLNTADRLYRVFVGITSSVAGAAVAAAVLNFLPQTWAGGLGAVAGLLVALAALIKESLDISLNRYRYDQLSKDTRELDKEIEGTTDPTPEKIVEWKTRKMDLDSREPSDYAVVHFQARNDVVYRHLMFKKSGVAVIPFRRWITGQFFYHDDFRPQWTRTAPFKSSGGIERS